MVSVPLLLVIEVLDFERLAFLKRYLASGDEKWLTLVKKVQWMLENPRRRVNSESIRHVMGLWNEAFESEL